MRRPCLVLDFDGTILDTEEPNYRSWAELWEHHGHELALSKWQAIIGTGQVFDPWVELEHRLGRPLDPTRNEDRRARRDELQALQGLRPGVLAWLADAEDLGVPVGIASSSPFGWVAGHLKRLEIEHRFACIVCCDDEIPAKPNPISYRLACDRLNAEQSHSVAVEDSPHGLAAAGAAGLFTVAVPHGLTADLDLSAADLSAASLDSLSLSDVLAEASRRPPP